MLRSEPSKMKSKKSIGSKEILSLDPDLSIQTESDQGTRVRIRNPLDPAYYVRNQEK